MATNDFLPFAVGGSANVPTQATYLANTTLLQNGVQTGIGSSQYANKCWRQSSIMASVIAQYINNVLNVSTTDDGTTNTLLSNFAQAVRLDAYAVDTGTVNAITSSISPAPPSLIDGIIVSVKPLYTNTGATTFNLNGTGNIAVQTTVGALSGGELVLGKIYNLAYLSSSNVWLIIGAGGNTAVTQASSDNSTKVATTAFVKSLAYAPIASPAFTGSPTAPTPGGGDNSTNIATTAFVQGNFAALYSPAFTGSPTAPTQSTGDNSTKIATTAFVKSLAYAPIASPAFTGVPTAPTPSPGDNSTEIATTAFVTALLNSSYQSFPSGTLLHFPQASAPIGWTQITDTRANNRMCRVVTSGGGSYGGIHDPTSCSFVASHTHGVTTGNPSQTHNHADAGHSHSFNSYSTFQSSSGSTTPVWYSTSSGVTGSGYASLGIESQNHTHSGTSDNGSSQTNFQPFHLDFILASKN